MDFRSSARDPREWDHRPPRLLVKCAVGLRGGARDPGDCGPRATSMAWWSFPRHGRRAWLPRAGALGHEAGQRANSASVCSPVLTCTKMLDAPRKAVVATLEGNRTWPEAIGRPSPAPHAPSASPLDKTPERSRLGAHLSRRSRRCERGAEERTRALFFISNATSRVVSSDQLLGLCTRQRAERYEVGRRRWRAPPPFRPSRARRRWRSTSAVLVATMSTFLLP